MTKSDFIDDVGRIYPDCTRREALDASSDCRPGLRPRSQWTADEQEFAAEHNFGEIKTENCPACDEKFRRRITDQVVGCPRCEPGTLETRGLR